MVTQTVIVTRQLSLCSLTPLDINLLPCNLPPRLQYHPIPGFGLFSSVSPCRKAEGQKQYPAFLLSWPPKLQALLPCPSLFVSVKAEATFCHLAHSSAANLHYEPSSCVFIYTVICTVTDESVCDTAVPNSDSFFRVYITQL